MRHDQTVRRFTLLAACGALALGACGGSDDPVSGDPVSDDPGSDDPVTDDLDTDDLDPLEVAEAAADDAEGTVELNEPLGDADGAVDGSSGEAEQDPVDLIRSLLPGGASEIDLADGGLLAAGIDCNTGQEGVGILLVGGRGLPADLEIDVSTEPSSGVDRTIVQADGTTYLAYQGTFDQFVIDVQFPGLDGGVSTSVSGCT